jgi:CheY-like chemotaxis protein
MHALVVDDNDINRILAARLLHRAGWKVAEADSGEAALGFLKEHAVDLVLLDVSMPGMSGAEACGRIRQERLGGEGVKVVAYTAHAMPEEISDLLKAGFDTVLLKPLSKDGLIKTLTELGFATS